jgi:catechol 2,3-dioxygenase-like lactoylglutathione lyase family enzyme
MRLIDHVSIAVNDLDRARRFCTAAADPRRHWCFRAPSAAAVRAFHAAGLAAGGADAGAPGLRPNYHPAYYAAFLIDPEGNRVEAVSHQGDDR